MRDRDGTMPAAGEIHLRAAGLVAKILLRTRWELIVRPSSRMR